MTELKTQYDLDQLDKVLKAQDHLSLDLVDSNTMWNSLQNQIKKEPTKNIKEVKNRRPIAYILILLVGILAALYFINHSSETEIKTNKAEQNKHQFADGSRVLLAPESSLRFNAHNWEQDRTLQLQGQAQFDVTAGTPFVVKTEMGEITVLGTSFEIWQVNNQLKLSCFEGKVQLKTKMHQSIEVEAGKEVLLTSAGLSDLVSHSNDAASFLRESMSYEKIGVLELAKEFSRFYNIPVNLDLTDTNKYFSGILILDNKEQAASIIAQTMGWKYDTQKTGIRFYE